MTDSPVVVTDWLAAGHLFPTALCLTERQEGLDWFLLLEARGSPEVLLPGQKAGGLGAATADGRAGLALLWQWLVRPVAAAAAAFASQDSQRPMLA